MKIGDEVLVTDCRRKGIIIDIDYLSDIGSYPDVYVVKMCKSGEETECTKKFLKPWKKHCITNH